MRKATSDLLDTGLYSVAEASVLTATPARTIRRWIGGERRRRRGGLRETRAAWTPEIGSIDGHLTLSFLDLLETRFIRAFRRHRVSWAAIREAAELAREMYDDAHPFARRRFRTDGRRIFSQIEDSGQVRLFDLNRRSRAFHDIVGQSLYDGVEFQDDQAVRWFPAWPDRRVVIDPRRAFGRPLVLPGWVPTDVLAAAASGKGEAAAVARWYRLPVGAVEAAIAFESRLAAQPAELR